jgi:predicted nucleotidyltransferase
MRIHDAIGDLLSTPTRLRVLRLLVRFPTRSWTGRELAKAAGSSPPQTLESLKQFESLGVVWREVVGRAHVWHLAPDHVLVGPIRSLFSFEASLPSRFVAELRAALGELPLRRATLFGSVARGTETNASDADVFVELRDSASKEGVEAALTAITEDFIRRYGMILSPLVCSSGETPNPRNPALMNAIEREGIQLFPGST